MIGCSKSHAYFSPIRVQYFSVATKVCSKISLRHPLLVFSRSKVAKPKAKVDGEPDYYTIEDFFIGEKRHFPVITSTSFELNIWDQLK